jgi:hypothetical protein
MATRTMSVPDQTWPPEHETKNEAHSSGVSWPAVIAGAFVAAALSLILLALGTGIGLSAISPPWEGAGASASAVGKGAIVWLILTELIASSIGGYLAGRLRTKWVNIHTDEVYFRDTAHGFLVWAVGLVIAAAFLASAAAPVGRTARSGAVAAEGSGIATSRGTFGPNEYFVDSLLRTSSPSAAQDDAAIRNEVGVIFVDALRQGNIPAADKSYLAQVVAARTGVNPSDAEKRVDDVLAQATQAADTARKALAHTMYWTFLALLVGAFCASLAATVGGKQRDRVLIV